MKKKVLFILLTLLMGFLSCYDGMLDTYDKAEVYKLRDKGPAGGWIFYVNPNWEKDGWRYLEAAPADQTTYQLWSAPSNVIVGVEAQGTAVGTGEANTIAIVNKSGLTSSVAKLCYDLVLNGYSDWFLPSKDELKLMYDNLHNQPTPVGGFGYPYDWWWSSSEVDTSAANYQIFGSGEQGIYYKSEPCRVRAVRKF